MIELLELKFPAAGKQTKLNLIGRIHHVTHFRANSVHLVRTQMSVYWILGFSTWNSNILLLVFLAVDFHRFVSKIYYLVELAY